MEKIVSVAQMRRAEERTAAAGTSTAQLMRNAGTAAAEVIAGALERGDSAAHVVVLCGPGNNGGDGLVAADSLAGRGYTVTAYTVLRPAGGDIVSNGVACNVIRQQDDPELTQLAGLLDGAAVIVDALLGTGRSRPIEGPLGAVLDAVRNAVLGGVVVALDLPSGVDADTGAADPHTLPTSVTIAFGYLKRGLLHGAGAELAGHVIAVEIGLAEDAAADVAMWRVDEAEVRQRIPSRARDVHKYSAGAVLVLAGSRRFSGAPRLAVLGAARAGAGLVTLATGASTYPIVAPSVLEPTFLVLPDDDEGVLEPAGAVAAIRAAAGRYKALLVGPGLAHAEKTTRLIEALLRPDGLPLELPMVIDAEGLAALSSIDGWWRLAPRPLVLTPHGGEMGRLCGCSASEVEARRFDIAAEQAAAWGVVVVLKGGPTVTAAPDGRVAVNATGGPNLASGGTGDVLGGVIASLIAQGADPFDAAVAGVFIHGRAGDLLAERHGDRGTLAGDLLAEIPLAIKAIRDGDD